MLMEKHDWKNDPNFLEGWLAMNWELLIGRELLGKRVYLLPLRFERFKKFPDSEAYSKVVCKLAPEVEMMDAIQHTNNYNEEELVVFSFCTRSEDKYNFSPPFDCIEARTCDTKKAYIVPIRKCRFYLTEILDLSCL
jgi:hypothetical protein